MKTTAWCFGLSVLAVLSCSGNKPGTNGTGGTGGTSQGTAGTSGSAGTSGGAGTTGGAGTSGGAGTTGGAGTSGDAGTTGGAGTSGAAGTGGTASGGSGGTGGSTCVPPALDAGVGACDNPPARPSQTLGFAGTPLQTALVGSIAQVDDNRLTIASDGGAIATFDWIGPPLSAQFSVGDAVTAQGGQSSSAWSVVKSARATAAIYAMYSSTVPIVPGQVPGGPSYVLAPSCTTTTRCDQPFVVATTYQRLTASSGSESAVIEPGATGQVGGWRMTNVLSTQQRCFGSCTVVDPESWHVVSALGPP